LLNHSWDRALVFRARYTASAKGAGKPIVVEVDLSSTNVKAVADGGAVAATACIAIDAIGNTRRGSLTPGFI
jgi:hypothetical protein